MERDGQRTSIWQATVKPSTVQIDNHSLSANNKYDVVIAGAGITGIVTGLLLQLAGKNVMIAEAHTIGFGTTGGTTAHINTFLDVPYYQIAKNFNEEVATEVAKAVANALALIKQNVNQFNINCEYIEQDGYLYAQDEKQEEELQKIIASCKKVGVEVSSCENIPVPIKFLSAAKFSGQASFHPLTYLFHLADIFSKAGGTILEDCRIIDLEENDKTVTVKTSLDKTFIAKDFIYCTHIPPGTNVLHFMSAPYRSYAMAVKLSDENYPSGLVYDLYNPYHYFRTQEIDGQKYMIAGGEDHKTGHEENTAKCFENLEKYLRENFAIERISYKWSSQYFEPADGLPYIGILPSYKKHVYTATGYGGNGMMYSHIAAKILTGMITGKSSGHEDLFNPARVKPIASFSNVVKEGADVTLNLLKTILPAEKIKGLDEIGNDEAKIINYDGNTIAAYRDEKGHLYMVNPTCTHLGCTVGWNNEEKSWDCPCHGARYNCKGEVLTGPAVKDLERYTQALPVDKQ